MNSQEENNQNAKHLLIKLQGLLLFSLLTFGAQGALLVYCAMVVIFLKIKEAEPILAPVYDLDSYREAKKRKLKSMKKAA